MAAEALVAVVAGLQASSFALMAFGGDSFIELLSAYAVASYLKSVLLADGGKRQGELPVPESRKTEVAATAFLFALIPVIGLGAAYSIATGITATGSFPGIAVAVGAVIIMPYLWIGKRRIGRETNCAPLVIDATESATCLFMALALLGGLLSEFFLKIAWADYLATAVILLFVAKEAVESYRELQA